MTGRAACDCPIRVGTRTSNTRGGSKALTDPTACRCAATIANPVNGTIMP